MALVSWFPLTGDYIDRVNGQIFGNTTAPSKYYTFASSGDSFPLSLVKPSSGNTCVGVDLNPLNIFNSNFFSISFWIYPIDSSSSVIFGNDTYRMYTVYQYPTMNDLHISWRNYDGTDYAVAELDGVLPTATWSNVIITYSGTEGVYIYIDGVLKWSLAKTTPISWTDTEIISTQKDLMYSSSHRYLNDVRIYNHKLSTKEISELSQGILLYRFNNFFTSTSTDNLVLSKLYNEGGIVPSTYGFNDSGNVAYATSANKNFLNFTGSYSNYLKTNCNLVTDVIPSLSNKFTYMAWVYFDSANAPDYYGMVMGCGRNYGNARGAEFGIVTSNGYPTYHLGNGTTCVAPQVAVDVRNAWHHLCLSYDNTTAKFYIDGELKSSSSIAGPLTYGDIGTYDIVIGKMAHGYSSTSTYFPFAGKMTDIRIYANTLSADAIKRIVKVRKSISRSGEMFVPDVYEDYSKNNSIRNHEGQITAQYSEIITLNDGSMWLQLSHQDLNGNVNGDNLFDSGYAVRNCSYSINENCWCNYPVIKTCNHGTNYEFLVIQQEGNSKALTRHRWIQTTSPYDSTYSNTLNANITTVSNIGSSYGGMYVGGENNAWYFNNGVDGNWYGCCLIAGNSWNSGIPGYNGVACKYIQDVYIRVYSTIYSERKNDIISTKEIKCI